MARRRLLRHRPAFDRRGLRRKLLRRRHEPEDAGHPLKPILSQTLGPAAELFRRRADGNDHLPPQPLDSRGDEFREDVLELPLHGFADDGRGPRNLRDLLSLARRPPISRLPRVSVADDAHVEGLAGLRKAEERKDRPGQRALHGSDRPNQGGQVFRSGTARVDELRLAFRRDRDPDGTAVALLAHDGLHPPQLHGPHVLRRLRDHLRQHRARLILGGRHGGARPARRNGPPANCEPELDRGHVSARRRRLPRLFRRHGEDERRPACRGRRDRRGRESRRPGQARAGVRCREAADRGRRRRRDRER